MYESRWHDLTAGASSFRKAYVAKEREWVLEAKERTYLATAPPKPFDNGSRKLDREGSFRT